jgi:hypothetical protein
LELPRKKRIPGEAHGVDGIMERALHEQVVAVFTFRGDKIARLDTCLSDVAMMETFFAVKS